MTMHTDRIGRLLIVECEGSISSADAAATLRDTVTSESDIRTIVVDFSKVDYVTRTGVAVLAYLQRWAQECNVQLKLFNPSRSVRHMLKQAGSIFQFDFASLDETMALVIRADYELQLSNGGQLQHQA
jgi:anti-anti-sigma factor